MQGKSLVTIVKIDTMKDKELIIKYKNKLKGTHYFSESVQIQAEAKLQKGLRDMARGKREKVVKQRLD